MKKKWESTASIQKSNLILVNTRELGRVPSTSESTLYISNIWCMTLSSLCVT